MSSDFSVRKPLRPYNTESYRPGRLLGAPETTSKILYLATKALLLGYMQQALTSRMHKNLITTSCQKYKSPLVGCVPTTIELLPVGQLARAESVCELSDSLTFNSPSATTASQTHKSLITISCRIHDQPPATSPAPNLTIALNACELLHGPLHPARTLSQLKGTSQLRVVRPIELNDLRPPPKYTNSYHNLCRNHEPETTTHLLPRSHGCDELRASAKSSTTPAPGDDSPDSSTTQSPAFRPPVARGLGSTRTHEPPPKRAKTLSRPPAKITKHQTPSPPIQR